MPIFCKTLHFITVTLYDCEQCFKVFVLNIIFRQQIVTYWTSCDGHVMLILCCYAQMIRIDRILSSLFEYLSNFIIPTVVVAPNCTVTSHRGANCTFLCKNRRTPDRNKVEGCIFFEVKVKVLQNKGKILKKYDKQGLTLKIYNMSKLTFSKKIAGFPL